VAARQTIPRPARWVRAASPVWRPDIDLAGLTGRPPVTPLGSNAALDLVHEALIDTSRSADGVVQPRPSAVLVALSDTLPGQSGVHVLVTRRASHLRFHAGEVSFPGGRLEVGETPVQAALREAFEEVALDPTTVAVHGELPHQRTLSSASSIVPVVASVAEPRPLTASPDEVDDAYWVPVSTLIAPGVHHRELWKRDSHPWPIDFFELADDIIWGATARMLVALLARGE